MARKKLELNKCIVCRKAPEEITAEANNAKTVRVVITCMKRPDHQITVDKKTRAMAARLWNKINPAKETKTNGGKRVGNRGKVSASGRGTRGNRV